MDNLPVIHLDNQGGTGYIDVFNNYTDLITQYPSPPTMSLAYVQNSQGTAWLPGGMGGNFYSKGSYLFDGVNWVSSVDDIAKELQDILDVMNTQNLEQVLAQGIFSGPYNISMNDAQIIKASNGFGSLNLRDGADSRVNLKNDKVSFSLIDYIARITSGAFFVDPFIGSLSIGQQDAQISMSKGDLSKNGILGFLNNENGDRTSINTPSYPTSASSQNLLIKQSVINVDVSGGKDIIVKTDNANYCNKVAYNKNSEAFETVVEHITPTANRKQFHPDGNGRLALTSFPDSEVLTPPTLTADVNNYNPTGFHDANNNVKVRLLRVSSNGGIDEITGLSKSLTNTRDIVTIINVGASGSVSIRNNDAGSQPENRFILNGNNLLVPNEAATYYYDTDSLRWRSMSDYK